MKTRLQIANPQHEIAYQDIVALVRKHGEHISAVEMLPIAANMLGKLLAYQDQRTMTSAAAIFTLRIPMPFTLCRSAAGR